VGALRRRFDPSARLNMPAHVTLLYPFMPPELVTEAVTSRARLAAEGAVAFRYRLVRICRFAETLYLSVEPVEPFVALTRRLAEEFPHFPPYGGRHQDVVPHLTVAHGEHDIDGVARELSRSLPDGGIAARCTEFVLMENSSGLWEVRQMFPLAVR
jgi:2'-5' RNA ligase